MSILQLDSNLINCSVVSSSQVMCNGKPYMLGEEDHSGTPRFWIDIGVVIGLVLLAGLMSGLTMGLMSMDKLNLKIMQNSQDEKQKKWANKILPLVERHHLLLVTLLLTNAVCAEALPIFLDRLVHPAVAIAISVSLVLLFGEIIPQAVCTRYGLQIGSGLSWLVWIMIGILLPIAWPIGKLLDAVLGKDTGTFFRRAELKELVHLHAEDVHNPEGESLTTDEVRIIKGAIDMKEKDVENALTPIDQVYAIDVDANLSREILQQIVNAGHDRIPVFHRTRDHFIGMILVKDLVLVDPNANEPVRNIKLYRVPIVGDDMPLYDMLHQFQTGRSHMAIVLDCKDHITPKGIITLEDVMEELLQEEIFDEDDFRRQEGTSSVVHDIQLAKAFIPRKYPRSTRSRRLDFFMTQKRYSLAGVAQRKQSVAFATNGQPPNPRGPPPQYLPQAPSHIRQRSMSTVPSRDHHVINLSSSAGVRGSLISPPNVHQHYPNQNINPNQNIAVNNPNPTSTEQTPLLSSGKSAN